MLLGTRWEDSELLGTRTLSDKLLAGNTGPRNRSHCLFRCMGGCPSMLIVAVFLDVMEISSNPMAREFTTLKCILIDGKERHSSNRL